jgi:hypothetical protein
MAKAKSKGKDAKEAVETPSQYGSHASMTDEDLTGKIAEAKQDAGDGWVILTDERGTYATRQSALDTGLADPLRCAELAIRNERMTELTG